MVGLSTQDQKEEKDVCVSGLVEESQPCSPCGKPESKKELPQGSGLWLPQLWSACDHPRAAI